MLRAAVSVVALLGLIAIVASEDEVTFNGPSGLKVHCSRKGARITVYRSVSNGTSTGKITVSFTELSERDANGDAVSGQSGGKGKHTYNAFDKQDFTISELSDVTLANSNHVNASCLAVTTSLQEVSGATFSGQVCAVKDNGTLFLGDENSTVSAGQLKFTVKVTNWVWETAGKYLDLKINIKIPPGQIVREEGDSGQGKKHPKMFMFGGGAAASFSTQVSLDGSMYSMPTGYPMYENKGANNYITIRIPKFNNTCEYDPSIDPGSSPESSSPSKGSFILPSSVSLGILCFLMALVIHL